MPGEVKQRGKLRSAPSDQIRSTDQHSIRAGILNDAPMSDSPSTVYDETDHVSVKEESKYDSASVQTSESDAETYKNGSDSEQADNFDWEDEDPVEDRRCDGKREIRGRRSCFLCLDRRSSLGSWIVYVILTLISVGVCVGVFIAVHPVDSDPTMTSYNLCLWFTFIAFMFCISFVMQCAIELFPFLLKKIVETFYPTRSEYLRSRLSYYMALKSYTKIVAMGAWAWGSWAFIRRHIDKPSRPIYVRTLEYVWECFFILTLFLFVEKFLLQFIVTSFHKKAYGDRFVQNERALKILDKLKKVKRKCPQDFLLKRIRKPKRSGAATGKKYTGGETEYIYRPADYKNLGAAAAANNNNNNNQSSTSMHKSIMNKNYEIPLNDEGEKQNVRFPSSSNMDTLIAIPPLSQRNSDSSAVAAATTQDIELEQRENGNGQDSSNTSSRKPSVVNSIYHRITSKSKKPKKTERELREEEEERDEVREERRLEGFDQRRQLFDGNGTPIDSKKPSRPKQLMRSNTSISSLSTSSSIERSFLSFGQLFKENALVLDPIHEAKILAKRIYHNIMGPNPVRHYVVEADLYDFFRTHDDAKEAFRLFDEDSNGDISRREMRAACIRIYCERKDLARSMRDMSQATGKLDIILMVVFACIWAIVVMAVFGVDIGTQLMPLWSAFIAASFIFGNSAKEAFESIIFVFVTHAFDTGDRILIGSENWTVAETGLQVSTFLKWDGSVVYAKNSVLATQYIINCRRSGCTTESFDIEISYHTPSWKIHAVREHMIKWSNQYPKLYTPDSCGANVVDIDNLNRITLTFYVEHTKNFQDAGGRWMRHNNFMLELKDELQRLKITYTKPDQPVVHRYKNRKGGVAGDDDDDDNDDDKMTEDENDFAYRDPENKKWNRMYNSTSNYQNHAGSDAHGMSHPPEQDGTDVGATAGAAATVAFTTAAI
ncbi:hypothetical protein MBANPS3_006896 [Mucor bainieri]